MIPEADRKQAIGARMQQSELGEIVDMKRAPWHARWVIQFQLASFILIMAYTSHLAVAVVLGLVLHRLYSAYKARQLQRLLHIPDVKFDHDDTQAHYISNTKEILHKGYIKACDTIVQCQLSQNANDV